MKVLSVCVLCAEVVLSKDQKQVYPTSRKKQAQKEVRLLVGKEKGSDKKDVLPAKIEVREIEGMEDQPLFSFSLKHLVSVCKTLIKEGKLLITFCNKQTSAREIGFSDSGACDVSRAERVDLSLREADPKNLENLLRLINEIKMGKFVFPSEDQKRNKEEMEAESMKNGGSKNKKDDLDLLRKSEKVLPKLTLKDFNPTPRDIHQEQLKIKSLMVSSNQRKKEIQGASGQKNPDLLLNKMYFTRIIEMIDEKDLQNLMMANRKFYSTICSLRIELDLSKFTEIPEKFVIGLLKRYDKIEHFISGTMSKFKPNLEKFKEIKLLNLTSIDLSKMDSFTDAMVALIIQIAPNATRIAVPFFGLSTHSLLRMNDSFKQLETFKAVHEGKYLPQSGVVNRKLSTKAVSQLLLDQPKLKEFHIYSCEPGVLGVQKRSLEPIPPVFSIPAKLTSFTIDNILIQGKEDLSHLLPLSQCKSLRKLVLGDLHLFDDVTCSILPLPNLPSEETTSLLDTLCGGLPDLLSVTLGDFSENAHLVILSNKLKSLRSFTVRSPHVTDDGLSEVLRKCRGLQKVRIEGCDRVHGYAFDDVGEGSKIREIGTSLDMNTSELIQKAMKAKGVHNCIVVQFV